MAVRTLFLSYARDDGPGAADVEADLVAAGVEVWRDERLTGGQDWWQEILARIRSCDVFVSLVSPASVRSLPCIRELDYATRLGKPVLPVRVGGELVAGALPTTLATRQLVDYQGDKHSALRLIRALAEIPAARPLPDPLPDPPAAPLSYTNEIASAVHAPEALDESAVRSIGERLAKGLRDPDREVVETCRSLLATLVARREVVGDVERDLSRLLRGAGAPPTEASVASAVPDVDTAGPPASVHRRLLRPGRPLVTMLLCAGWLFWVVVGHFYVGDNYAPPQFTVLALATVVAAAFDWLRSPGHAGWMVLVAAHSAAAAVHLSSELSSEQAAGQQAAAAAFAAVGVVAAVRLRARDRHHDEAPLVLFAALLLGAWTGMLVHTRLQDLNEYDYTGSVQLVVNGLLFAAGLTCLWTVLVRPLAASTRGAVPS